MINFGELHNERGVIVRRCAYEKKRRFGKISEIEIDPIKQNVQHSITLTYVFNPEFNYFDVHAYAVNVDSGKSFEVM